jgi:hypothetical protein
MLAQYQRFPEGFEFEHRLVGEERPRSVILLSPPGQVAVGDKNGVCARHSRQEQHGPAPYSTNWCSMYLRESGLPSYFMTEEHRSMSITSHEQIAVGIQHAAHPCYLEVRYPRTPMRPIAKGGPASFFFNVTKQQPLILARNFPAINLVVSNTTVLVTSDGYVIIDSSSDKTAHIAPDEVAWSTENIKSSYIVERQTTNYDGYAVISDAQYRQELIRAVRLEGSRINPLVSPEGSGYWEWLEPTVDSKRAEILGYFDASAMAAARLRGLCIKGMSRNDSPAIVWRLHAEPEPRQESVSCEVPDFWNPRHWNPSQQPPGKGVWKFAEESYQGKASLLFGNIEEFNTAGIASPDAAMIFTLRQQFQFQINKGRLSVDPTQSITLLWDVSMQSDAARRVAVSAVHSSSTQDTGTADEESANSDELPPPDHDFGYDERSMLRHNPMNGHLPGPPYDQRGLIGEAHYMTADIHGTTITLDLSPARKGMPCQAHKLRVYDTRWHPFQPADALFDWSDDASIKQLNKWREYIMRRKQWPRLREFHKTITTEQRAWLIDYVLLEGNVPPGHYKQVATKFNQNFGLVGDQAREDFTMMKICGLLRGQQEAAAREVKEPEVRETKAIDNIMDPKAMVQYHTALMRKKQEASAARNRQEEQVSGLSDDGDGQDQYGSDADAEHEIEDVEM